MASQCRLGVVLSLVTLAPVCAAAQKAGSNRLTPQEASNGTSLLFDGETTFGWRSHGDLAAKEGALVLGGPASEISYAGPATLFGSFELTLEYQGAGRFGAVAADDWNAHSVQGATGVGLEGNGWKSLHLTMRIVPKKRPGEIRVDKVILNEAGRQVVMTASRPTFLGFVTRPKQVLRLRNLKMKPTPMESLFNGNDLSGWRVFPGKKSEFAVLDGAINVKNGPGDLQTERIFADFLLQFECKSHGDHLNSGLFFRCRPNEYQNGYEAQVRNQFTEKPTQEYLLEEYDPKTNELLGKKKEFYTAVDFGTGAIYRRQPARKAMSKDHEWFTMTIVAHGNHLATWVTGVQVTDWYDHRPPSDNARTGFRSAAGHLSLQGHDPTTNLSFRGFRIQDYATPRGESSSP